MGIILVLVFVIFLSFGRLELVEQKKFRDLETNAFPTDVEPMLM